LSPPLNFDNLEEKEKRERERKTERERERERETETASLGYITRPCLKKNPKKLQKNTYSIRQLI
jgi:hypothetical protein